MVKIRLRRVAKKGRAQYRLVVADSRSPQGGRFIEIVGTYDSMQDPPAFTVKEDRIKEWMSKGARPTDSARSLLERAGLLPKTERQQLHRAPKKAPKPEAAPKPAAEAAPVAEAEVAAAPEAEAEAAPEAEVAEAPAVAPAAEAEVEVEAEAEPEAEAKVEE